ncbi:hypothetical protein F3G48_32385, partial [Pseudomonas aeruginosa]
DWDETVPSDMLSQWHLFTSEFHYLKDIKIPRLIVPPHSKSYELVGFCDGSTKAYGCSVYLRITTDTEITSHLLIAKSKVAPLKVLTVNRLELFSDVLLAKILKHISNLLNESQTSNITLSKLWAFTDSSTVLSWLQTAPHRLKTFVAHRV